MSDLAGWVDRTGVRLATPLDGAAQDIAPLEAALGPIIAGADLVFLGEMNHFVHEKSDFRLLLARFLLRHGVSVFAEELGWSDGERLARWFAGADDGALDGLSLFGSEEGARSDRDDHPTGLFAASFKTYPREQMRFEQERFYRGLKAAGPPAGYFGFDIDALPGAGYADIARRLAPRAREPAVGEFLKRMARAPGETAAEEGARLSALAPPPDPAAAAALAALADSFRYIALTYPAATYEAVRPGMAYREEAMKRRFADLRRLSGGAPAAVMSHGLHLAKDDGLIGEAPGVGPGGGQTASIGHHLTQDLGLKVASIWMLYGAGEDSQPMPDLPRKAAYPADTLNAELAHLAAPTLFPIAGGPFSAPRKVGHMYNAVVPVTLAGTVDAILFLPRVTPMRTR